MKIKLDKAASAAKNCPLAGEVMLSPDITPEEGFVIAGEILTEKTVYNTLELSGGRMSRLRKGDIIAGVLGARNALRGYSGVVPESIKPGDVLQVLNLGGVVGRCTGENPDMGAPTDLKVLGAVLHFPSFKERVGEPANVLNGPVKQRKLLLSAPPLVIVSGTCMQAGKTSAACEIIKQLTMAGKKAAAGKLTGISLQRDILEMIDFGAVKAFSFADAGIVCTRHENAVAAAKGIVYELAKENPDCIVLELGDGIMGRYGVMEILLDAELMSFAAAHVLSANDPAGAWGAKHYLSGKCPPVDVVTGPATDNRSGSSFIESNLEIRAANARSEGEELGRIILEKLKSWKPKKDIS